MPAKYEVRITPTAESDTETIWDFIAEDSPENAARFVSQLEEQIDTLERFPERCPLIPENEVLSSDYRHLVLGNYRIIFRITGTTVFILRIIHGTRLLDTSLFEI